MLWVLGVATLQDESISICRILEWIGEKI